MATSTRQLSYDPNARTFSGEISSTNGFERVYPDACDEGMTLVSHRTGTEVKFVVTDEKRDAEGDVQYWMLSSLNGAGRVDSGGYSLQLFND